MGVAQAEVLSAGPRRSTIEFVTPERVTYRPELGVLYPSELATGMRIYVEYNKKDPNLVRVQHRNAGLAIIPAGSIAVVGWLAATILLLGLALLDKRLDRREVPSTDALTSKFRAPYALTKPCRQPTLTLSVSCALRSSPNPSSPKSMVSATRFFGYSSICAEQATKR